MNKIAYIACSYQNRHNYLSLIESIKDFLQQYEWETTIPVYDLSNIPANDYLQIMNESFNRLRNSALLIAEASEKNIGIGIEVGFAKALNIPIIYLYRTNAELSTTVAGSANYVISYLSNEDAINKIQSYFENLK